MGQELVDLAKAVKEATSLRNRSNAQNTQVIADKASADAVGEAIATLRRFYGEKVEVAGSTSLSLLEQEPDEAAAEDEEKEEGEKMIWDKKGEEAPTFDFGAGRRDSTHTIIGVLETAQADFTKVAQETEQEEREQAESYKKEMQEAEVTKAKKNALILGKDAEIKTLNVTISMTKDDIDGTTKELDAVMKTLEALNQQCANTAMSYEERKHRREAEIAGLKSALDILSEDNMSFLQKRV